MISATEKARTGELKASPAPVKQYIGEVVYIHAYDVAYDMTRQPIVELLGQPVAQFAVDASKRLPRHLFFYRPQMSGCRRWNALGRTARCGWSGW